MCDDPFSKEGENVTLLAFDSVLNIIAEKEHRIPLSVGFIEHEGEQIIVLSEMRTVEDSSNIKLSYFNFVGDSLDTESFRIPGNQSPTQILSLSADRSAITGSHNCCHLMVETGPGHSFLYLHDRTTSLWHVPVAKSIPVYPNPCTSVLHLDPEMGFEIQHAEMLIYSSLGILVKKILFIDNQPVSVEDLKDGVYYLQVVHKGDLFKSAFIKMPGE